MDIAWTPIFWHTARIMAACALAVAATSVLGLPDGYWALITAIIVTQPAFHATLQAGRNRIIGTVIGAVAGCLVIAGARAGWSLDLLFWIALLPLAVMTAIRPELRLSAVTLVVMVLIPGALSWQRPLDRVVDILIGTLASILVTAIPFPRKPAPEPHAAPDGSHAE
ncbi:MAG: FUSC family protein [Beijerinckiaceae bacterium]|nr:FUSC family protein [Beijerinckiaceae bacterium]